MSYKQSMVFVVLFGLAGGAVLGIANWLLSGYAWPSIFGVMAVSTAVGVLYSRQLDRLTKELRVWSFAGAGFGALVGFGAFSSHRVNVTWIPSLAMAFAELSLFIGYRQLRKSRSRSEITDDEPEGEDFPTVDLTETAEALALKVVPPPDKPVVAHNFKGDDFLEKITYVFLESEGRPYYLEGWHWSDMVPRLSLAVTAALFSLWGLVRFAGHEALLNALARTPVPAGLIIAFIGFILLMKRLSGKLVTWDRRKMAAIGVILVGVWIALRFTGIRQLFDLVAQGSSVLWLPAALAATLWGMYIVLVHNAGYVALTEDRLIFGVEGPRFIGRWHKEAIIGKTTNADFTQSEIQRLLGVSTVAVEGPGTENPKFGDLGPLTHGQILKRLITQMIIRLERNH